MTPTVSPDGYSIDVELEPQVIEFLGYDTSFNTTMILEGREIETKIGMMPILTNRRAKTKLVIWDGETIVLGGMIQEKLIPGRLIRLPETKGPLARERERYLNSGFHRFFIHWTPFFPSAYKGLFRIYLYRPNSTNSPPNFALNSRTP